MALGFACGLSFFVSVHLFRRSGIFLHGLFAHLMVIFFCFLHLLFSLELVSFELRSIFGTWTTNTCFGTLISCKRRTCWYTCYKLVTNFVYKLCLQTLFTCFTCFCCAFSTSCPLLKLRSLSCLALPWTTHHKRPQMTTDYHLFEEKRHDKRTSIQKISQKAIENYMMEILDPCNSELLDSVDQE